MDANADHRPARIFRQVTADIGCPGPEVRQSLLDLPADPSHHARALDQVPLLNVVETGGTAQEALLRARTPLHVVFWNAERMKYVDESAAFLDGLQADVMLLAEVDIGMARSQQKHTVRALAQALGMHYLYASEFVELGLGDQRERTWFAGEVNRCGLHGGAILSRCKLSDPAVIRLPEKGDWFDGRRGERRVGGRIVVVARVELAGAQTVLASAHLESHGSPATRAVEMALIVQALDDYADGAPVVLGGDFNTNTADRDVPDWQEQRRQIAATDPDRLAAPQPYEPMFRVMEEAGYDWRASNAPGTTQRTRPDGTPTPPFAKLDWLFSRGLTASEPAIHAAIPRDGSHAISDHEAISAVFSTASTGKT